MCVGGSLKKFQGMELLPLAKPLGDERRPQKGLDGKANWKCKNTVQTSQSQS